MTVGEPFSVSANQDLGVIPVDVRVVDDVTQTERKAPDFGSPNTFTLYVAGSTVQPVQVLTRRERRNKARLLVTSFNGLTSGTTQGVEGVTSTGPSPGTTVTQIGPLAPGTYTVNVTEMLSGTVTFADAFNTKLFLGGTAIATLVNQGSAEFANTTPPITVVIPAGATGGNATLFVITTGAGSGTAAYYAQMMVTPQLGSGSATAAVFHPRGELLMVPNIAADVGYQVTTTPFAFDWESEQPLFGVGIGGQVTVTAIDESYQ